MKPVSSSLWREQREKEVWPMTRERPVRARFWRTCKVGIHLPPWRGDLAWMRCDVQFYSCLSLTSVKSCSVCAKALPGQDCQSLPHIASWWQLWDDIMCRSRNEMLMLSRHLWQLCCHLFGPPVNFHRSGLYLDFFITLLAPVHWSLCHFPSGTQSSTSYFCMAYFILLPFCQKGSKIHNVD